MAYNSKIEWTESTWNPTTGCTKISVGCLNCYAEVLTKRFEKQWGKFTDVKLHYDRLKIPYKRKKPTQFFVNSMSDLFHTDIPDSFVSDVFKIMNECKHHIFQVLTKRADRLIELNSKLKWTSNIWMGVTIENKSYYNRIYLLRKCDAKIKFLSLEPLLESVVDIDLKGIDWVIVGGESGRKPRAIKKDWVIEVLDKCKKDGIPFFFKQWGGKNKKKSGRLLNGREYNQMPCYI